MKRRIKCPPHIPVSVYLLSQNIKLNTACGGRGNCARCLVKVVRGKATLSTMSKIQLSRQQIDDNIRLACHLIPEEEIEVEIC